MNETTGVYETKRQGCLGWLLGVICEKGLGWLWGYEMGLSPRETQMFLLEIGVTGFGSAGRQEMVASEALLPARADEAG